ncbi:MAG: DUF4364 family protein [Tissierellia bacterium]|nr:DUF4364 family protein [Tissierellia bacterium]
MFTENTEELAQNKLILLYIIDQSNTPMGNQEIIEFIMEDNYMNYFLIQEYLRELVESKLLREVEGDDDKAYILSNEGKVILSYFEGRIDDKIRKEILDKFSRFGKHQEKTARIIGEYHEGGDEGYIANLKLIDKHNIMLSLSITVPTAEQAKTICSIWKDNPEHLYEALFGILVDGPRFIED